MNVNQSQIDTLCEKMESAACPTEDVIYWIASPGVMDGIKREMAMMCYFDLDDGVLMNRASVDAATRSVKNFTQSQAFDYVVSRKDNRVKVVHYLQVLSALSPLASDIIKKISQYIYEDERLAAW